MRMFLAIGGLLLVAALSACGGGEDGVTDSSSTAAATQKSDKPESKPPEKPEVVPPEGPPPTKPVVKDVKLGSGRVARFGDWIDIYYIGVNYKTGKEIYVKWPPIPPSRYHLGVTDANEAWERGIEGMRVGGRRELTIPSHLLFGTGTIHYLVELVRVKPSADAGGNQ